MQSSAPPFFGAAFGFSQRLTAAPRPTKLSTLKLDKHLVYASFFHAIGWPQSSSSFNPTWPHLGPHVGPYKPLFCLPFSDHLSNSISDLIVHRFRPKSTSKSIKNLSDFSSKIKLQTCPISASSSIKFRRQSHVQAKWSMFKQRSKTKCFLYVF